MRAKANWTPKDYEEREIPLPDFLLAALKKRMLETKGKLIFPTAENKATAKHAPAVEVAGEESWAKRRFKLHKFRKTYATLQQRAGVDARTIQKRLGHSDLEHDARILGR